MACPLCGELCHCSFAPAGSGGSAAAPEKEAHTSVLIDPDAYDPSEEQFAASVLEIDDEPAATPGAVAEAPAAPARPTTLTGIERVMQEMSSNSRPPAGPDGEGWRDEVSSRLNNYRARRRRRGTEGAMPLDFGAEESPAPSMASYRSAAVERVAARFAGQPEMATAEEQEPNVIEFPKPAVAVPQPVQAMSLFRPVAVPSPAADELAEAIPETPRILDAPEPQEQAPVMPPVSAITLEGEEEVAMAGDPQPELMMYVAPVGRRALAGAVDAALVLLATAVFAVIFLKIGGSVPATKATLAMALGVLVLLWSIYEYLFVVYAGTTPGMEMAHLMLVDFRGERLDRAMRQFRVAGTIVAALPLGFGFLWVLLDEETLGWHDRMSRSCLAEIAQE